MKKLLFLFAFCLSCFVGFSQNYIQQFLYGVKYSRIRPDSIQGIPRKSSLRVSGTAGLDSLPQVFVLGHHLILYEAGNYWDVSAGAGAGGVDTTSLSNRINLKLNLLDTANMLIAYLRKSDAAVTYYPLTSNPAGYLASGYLNNVINSLQVVNAGGALSWQAGTYASRPSPGINGRFYLAIDSAKIYYDNSGGWVTVSGGAGAGGVSALAGLSDVTITTPSSGQLLKWNGTKWVNYTILASDVNAWLGYTPENSANKSNSPVLGTSTILYPTQDAVKLYADSILYKDLATANGVSKSPSFPIMTVFLGQTIGQAGNPAALTHHTEIPTGTFQFFLGSVSAGTYIEFDNNNSTIDIEDAGATSGVHWNVKVGGGSGNDVDMNFGDQNMNYNIATELLQFSASFYADGLGASSSGSIGSSQTFGPHNFFILSNTASGNDTIKLTPTLGFPRQLGVVKKGANSSHNVVLLSTTGLIYDEHGLSAATYSFSDSGKSVYFINAYPDTYIIGTTGGNGTSGGGGGSFTNPMTSVGDLIVGSTSGNPARLAIGSDTSVLVSIGGTEQWYKHYTFYRSGVGYKAGTTQDTVELGINDFLADVHFNGSGTYSLFLDSLLKFQVNAYGALNTVVDGMKTANQIAATSGNFQYGPSYKSEGQIFLTSTKEAGIGWYNHTNLIGSTAENRFTFESNFNGGPYSDQGYISDNPTGGRAHFTVGDFLAINASYQEVSATYSMQSSGFIYYNVATANSFTITLQSVASSLGGFETECHFLNAGSGTLTVKGNASENITFGASTANSFTLAQGKWAHLRLNAAGTAWYVVANN